MNASFIFQIVIGCPLCVIKKFLHLSQSCIKKVYPKLLEKNLHYVQYFHILDMLEMKRDAEKDICKFQLIN